MRAPKFWHKPRHKPGPWPRILTPFAAIWHWASHRRLARGSFEKMPVPVICVGNINVGGTGKTPTAIALQAVLIDMGHTAHIVSRGYGGSEIGPLQVNERQHNAAQVGDEPLLMSAFGPVWVAKNRAAGAHAAINAGAEIIVLDDGFQNPALAQDLSIVVVDAHIGFGNGCVMPSGPLREKLATGLLRADLIISIGTDAAQEKFGGEWPEIKGVQRLKARLKPLQTGMDWQGVRVVAFAGIGHPAKFFKTLQGEGAKIIATHEFADHAEYSNTVLQRLKAEAQKHNAQLVTTEKDAARLPAEFRAQVLVLPVRLEFEDPRILADILRGL